MRDRSHPHGFPWLVGQQAAKAEAANKLVLRSVEACAAIHEAGGFYLMEHPEDMGTTPEGAHPASIWQWPEVRRLAAMTKAATFALHQCNRKLFGAPPDRGVTDYPKPTRLLGTVHALSMMQGVSWP